MLFNLNVSVGSFYRRKRIGRRIVRCKFLRKSQTPKKDSVDLPIEMGGNRRRQRDTSVVGICREIGNQALFRRGVHFFLGLWRFDLRFSSPCNFYTAPGTCGRF